MAGSNSNSQLPEEKDKQQAQPQQPAPAGASVPAAAPSNYDDVYKFLQNEIANMKVETPEQKKKRERREKWEGIISGISDAVSSLSNLYFTSQYAPNMYDGTQSMSAKAKERRDKAKAEREANADGYLNYALTIGKLKDADEAKAYQRQRDAAADARDQRNYNLQVQQADRAANQWQQTFDRQGEWHKEDADHWERQFKESIRQFNVNSYRQQQSLSLQAKQLAHQMSQGSMTFNLGTDYGNVTLTQAQLNAQNVSRIYYTLPSSVRNNVHGSPIYETDITGKKIVTGYGDPSTEAMLIAIGQHIATGKDTQQTRDAIKQVAGLQQGNSKLPAAY